jgi:signal peptidase I
MPSKVHPSKRRLWLKNCRYWFCIVLAGILLAIILRVFFFAAFVIPTPSMEPAIIPGDKVIVYKQIPGPRIIRNFFSLHKGEKPDIIRLKGIRAVRRNDVLIFNFPYSDWSKLEMDMSVFYAKRCVAIPGDTFYIENRKLFPANGFSNNISATIRLIRVIRVPLVAVISGRNSNQKNS